MHAEFYFCCFHFHVKSYSGVNFLFLICMVMNADRFCQISCRLKHWPNCRIIAMLAVDCRSWSFPSFNQQIINWKRQTTFETKDNVVICITRRWNTFNVSNINDSVIWCVDIWKKKLYNHLSYASLSLVVWCGFSSSIEFGVLNWDLSSIYIAYIR